MSKQCSVFLPRLDAWTDGQLALVREYFPHVPTWAVAQALGRTEISVAHQARKMGLTKAPGVVAAIARERSLDPAHPMHRTGFQAGHVSWNKGKKLPPGWSPGRMAETQFKPGQQPHTTLPIGALRVGDGTLERKIADTPGRYDNRWRPVHRLVWEAVHGPVPKGHKLRFKPGRKSTVEAEITLDALELITDAENLQRNSIHNYPPELKSLMHLKGKLVRAINRRSDER